MLNLGATTYHERESHWRREAARSRTASERDACETLAEGYAELIAIVGESIPRVALTQYLVAKTKPRR